MVPNIKGDLAVITGAAHGVGREIALKCAELGANIALIDIDKMALDKLEQSLNTQYPSLKIHEFLCDVSIHEEYKKIVPKILSKFGTTCIQLLFNNVGVESLGTIIDGNLEWMKKTMNVNIWSMIYGIRLFLPYLMKNSMNKQCYIINTGSLGSIMFADGFYYVTKHAVLALSQTITTEINDLYKRKYNKTKSNIHIATLCPCYINDTNYWITSKKIHDCDDDTFNEFMDNRHIKEDIIRVISLSPKEVIDCLFEGLYNKKTVIYPDEKLSDAVIKDMFTYYKKGKLYEPKNVPKLVVKRLMSKYKNKSKL